MEVIQYSPDLLKPLTDFYNNLIQDVPYCYPVSINKFENVLKDLTGNLEDNDNKELDGETVFVIRNKCIVEAFVHIGTVSYQTSEEIGGIIKFLGYKRGSREAGQTAYNKAEEYLKENNATRIFAFPKQYKYPMYHYSYAYLSNSLDHIVALFGKNGYSRCNGQVFLNWKNYIVNPIVPTIPIELKLDWKDGKGKLQNCNLTAFLDGEEIGQCWTHSCGEFTNHQEVQDWVYIDWLGVEAEFQGRGLGKYLLEYTLYELKKVGYKHTTLSANWDNYPALLLYTNLGFRIIDWTYEYEKTFNEDSS